MATVTTLVRWLSEQAESQAVGSRDFGRGFMHAIKILATAPDDLPEEVQLNGGGGTRGYGSYFTIGVSTRMAGADWSGVLRPQTVQASDLHDALRKALAIPFPDWFADEDGKVDLEISVDAASRE